MTTEQLHAYRLTSMEEPTDEMLQAIMDQVGEEARKVSARVEAAKQRMLEEAINNAKQKLKLQQ